MNVYRMTTDQELVHEAIAGNEQAYRQLWELHSPHIDAVVRRLSGDPDLAADIAQDVWMQIFRALPSYRGDSRFGTWAHRIAINRTLNALRKIRRVAKAETDLEEAITLPGEEGEDMINRTFVAESIGDAVQMLSPGARTVFVLHDIEGYTHEEISRELGITSGGSKSQLFKARARLRRLLAHLQENSTQKLNAHVTSV